MNDTPTPLNQGCKLPPDGWYCSRDPGHEGPCAARPSAGFTEEQLIEAAWLYHVAHSPTDATKQFREALFEKFCRRTELVEARKERDAHKQTIDAVIKASRWDGCDGLAAFVENLRIERDEAQQWIDSDPDWKAKYIAINQHLTAERDQLRAEREQAIIATGIEGECDLPKAIRILHGNAKEYRWQIDKLTSERDALAAQLKASEKDTAQALHAHACEIERNTALAAQVAERDETIREYLKEAVAKLRAARNPNIVRHYFRGPGNQCAECGNFSDHDIHA